MAEIGCGYVKFGKGEVSRALWMAEQTKRFVELLEKCGLPATLCRETNFLGEGREAQSLKRIAIICKLPRAKSFRHVYRVAWDFPIDHTDADMSYAQLWFGQNYTEAELVSDCTYGQPDACQPCDQPQKTAFVFKFFPADKHVFLEWAIGRNCPDHVSRILQTYRARRIKSRPTLEPLLPKGEWDLEGAASFRLDVGWKLAEELIRCLVKTSLKAADSTR
ncbi:MAG: hypothetical protein WCW31_03900 [Patescibacteria group bacterium]